MTRAQFEGKWYDMDVPAERTEYRRLYNAMYYAKHKDKMKAYSTEYIKKRRQEDPEFRAKYNEYARTYVNKNAETVRLNARTRAYIRYTYDDEFRAAQQKKNRDRYQNDPVFRAKQREHYKNKYLRSEEFKEKQRKYCELYRALGKMSMDYFVVKME